MKVFLKIMLQILILLIPSFALCETASYCSIEELHKTAPTNFTCSRSTKWRSIDINAPVFIPRLKNQPVIRLTKAPAPSSEASIWPENAQFITDKKIQAAPWARFTVECNFPNPYQGIDLKKHSVLRKPWTDPIAENSDVSPSEAMIFASDLISKCLANVGINEFNLVGIQAHSAYYHYDDQQDEWLEKLTDTGFYSIGARQQFEGATLYNRGNYYWNSGKKSGDSYIPTCGIGAKIYNQDQYSLTFELFQMLEVIQNDIPLASWPMIENTINQLVDTGNIRDILSITYRDLGLFNAPDKANEFFAAPYWDIECMWAASGKDEQPAYADPASIQLNAQTGQLLDPNSIAVDRNTLSAILTWDDILK